MKFPTIILTSIALILLLISCNSSADRYVDEKGNFSIRFGGEPDITSQSQAFGFGTFKWKVADFQPTEGLNNYYSVSYLDLPKNIVTSDSLKLLPQLFNLTQSDFISQYGEGALLNQFTRTHKKYPGREYVWLDNSSKTGITRRYYLIRNRLYRLEVRYPIKNQHNPEVEVFFQSFKVDALLVNPNPEMKAPETRKNYTIEFPGKTQVKVQEAYGDFGLQSIRAEVHETNFGNSPDQSGNLIYMVINSSLPKKEIDKKSDEEKKSFLQINFEQNGMIRSSTIISQGEIIFNGTPCHEGFAEVQVANGTKLIAHIRSFLIENHFYQIVVASTIGNQNNQASVRFMESFRPND